jgi:hypothetical protein
MNYRKRIVMLCYAGVLFLSFLGAVPSEGVSAYMGIWTGENGNALFEIRHASGETYEVVLVDVFDREEENLQARVGSVFISKLQWDEKKFGFLGGTFESQRNDIDATFFCELWPQNDGTMKLILKKGWISRSMMLKRLED